MTEALGAALRTAAMEIAVPAAAEIRAQLPDHTGEVVLSDYDPALRITERSGVVAPCPAAQDPDARITLRLPPSLEQRIEDSAQPTGESVNAWVVDALGKRTRPNRGATKNFIQTFDL